MSDERPTRPPEPADAPPPPVVEELALGAFRLVKEKLDFELDFTPETLPVLDHFLMSLRDEDDGEVSQAVISFVGPCAGAYFGEVVRRSLGGLRWRCPDDDYPGWRLEGERAQLSFNPVGAALEALLGEPVPDFHAHLALAPSARDAIERALQATGPVREEDYYRLAVRWEVVEQVLGLLSVR